jgi:hypothetical protein
MIAKDCLIAENFKRGIIWSKIYHPNILLLNTLYDRRNEK